MTSKLAYKYDRERFLPLFKCLIVYFEGTSKCVCIYTCNISIFEGVILPFWYLIITPFPTE